MDQPQASATLAPIASSERIHALDVIRGFALMGIMFMNVEFFNRATGEIGSGMRPGESGADFWVSYFVQYFVVGKFWTIFSLLFGMGFAVMLIRAERAGRPFLVPYLRRIAALAVFGALHSIFLWSGDILFSYAVAATALLIVLYGKPKWIALAIAACTAGGFIPGFDALYGVAGGLAFFATAAWWLRGEQRVKRFGNQPAVGVVMAVAAGIALVAGVAMWFIPNSPPPARFALPLLGTVLSVAAYFTLRLHGDKAARPWRLGVGIYCFSFLMMTGVGAAQYYFPQKPPVVATKEGAKKAAEAAAEREKNLKKREQRIQGEIAVMSKGSYLDTVAWRAKRFAGHAPEEVGFATILIGMFLLGTWFVRSGIMERTQDHLPLFRKLALYGLPVGIGLGLLGSAIALHAVPGSRGTDGWQLAAGLRMLGNLPASLGYVSLIVLMLHSASPLNKVRLLAPFGRMALTNYLTQSLVASTFFFGYGFANWGMSRPGQMVFVAAVLLAQIVLSHVWLSRFRYGPVEWLWRAITYWQIPPMRLGPGGPMSAVASTA
ncbi:DUF418 domain-containing protein [Massilia sp. PAMC28688]|uniref:DUF418 domain-containing protein n=1 Tax=Massilia sp. PAMC28688 TaxID=2861283 RepID=UPI001C6345EC|nr:DUF418 domain-containing protein [Massilia sp. PAMC28688]QYF94584.1 DUF418 domain-containing protein [Massilia sp. PAMC28688]